MTSADEYITLQAVLDCPLSQPNDASAATVGAYLRALLLNLWRDGEGFNSKRPFGNSGWDYDISGALVRHGLIKDENEALELVSRAIMILE